MKLPHRNRNGRHGFTLIELLVVIAIIAVLAALTVGAAMKVRATATRTKNTNDILQLGSSVTKMQTDFHVTYIPSRIKLCETAVYPNLATKGTIDYDSVQFLNQLFPKIKLYATAPNPPVVIDWNGNGSKTADPDRILQGDQCLVFFLGGIPTISNGVHGCTGFTLNNANPANHVANPTGPPPSIPYYPFASNRLADFRKDGFCSYLDAYTTITDLTNPKVVPKPFVYFSCYGKTNGYNRYYNDALDPVTPAPLWPIKGTSDCNDWKLYPYAEAAGPATGFLPDLRYLKPDSFQIISAGADEQFGMGTWPQTTAALQAPYLWATSGATSLALYDSTTGKLLYGSDDQSNFAGGPLGAGR